MTRSCEFDGCDRPHYAHGYCATHWGQAKRRGQLTPVRVGSGRNPGTPDCKHPDCTLGAALPGAAQGRLERRQAEALNAARRMVRPAPEAVPPSRRGRPTRRRAGAAHHRRGDRAARPAPRPLRRLGRGRNARCRMTAATTTTRLWFAAYLCGRARWTTCTYLGPDRPSTCPKHGTEPLNPPELVDVHPGVTTGWEHDRPADA